jgi:glutaredoxin-dependent peroxiredoxin
MPLPAIGSPAPDFTLWSTSGSQVTLSSFRGKKVLLAFFPAAFTSVCTDEMCALSQGYDQFQNADTVVLPISVDAIPSLKEFKAKEKMKIDLLSDFRRQVTREYGTLIEDRFLSARAYVVIDREGIVRWTFSEETPAHRRENAELLEQLAKVA